MNLERDYTPKEVAEALGMSERWVRDRANDPDSPAEHIRYGHKLRFTAEQVEKLRAAHVKAAATPGASITSGPKKRSA